WRNRKRAACLAIGLLGAGRKRAPRMRSIAPVSSLQSPASSPSKARALSRRSGLQRATNDLFGGRRRLIDALQQAHDFRGFVSKRDERAESFAVRALTALRGNGR